MLRIYFWGLFLLFFSIILNASELTIRTDRAAHIANDVSAVVGEAITKCGVRVVNARAYGMPAPRTDAVDAWVNRQGKIFAYTDFVSLFAFGATGLQIKLLNGAEIASIPQLMGQVALQTRFGIAASAIEALTPYGLHLTYYCQGRYQVNAEQFKVCLITYFIQPVVQFACSN